MARVSGSTYLAALLTLCTACSGAVSAEGQQDDSKNADNPGSSSGGHSGSPAAGDAHIRNEQLGLTCTSGALPPPAVLARLTTLEYNNTLRDLLPGVTVAAQILPFESVTDGFSNEAAGQTPTATLIENFQTAAVSISAAAVDKVLPCHPNAPSEESACLSQFLATFGKRAFRRPLLSDETDRFNAAFADLRKANDFNTTMATLVEAMLQAPQFLYRAELGTTRRMGSGAVALSDYEMASRLSYLVWDSMPDADLFLAAEKGSLADAGGVETQFRRLLADPRAKPAVAEFFRQWLDLDRIDANIGKKNKTAFPKFSDTVAESLRAGNRRFVEASFWDNGGGLEKLLTDPRAFVDVNTAEMYAVKAPAAGPMTAIALDPAQRAGILTQAGMMAGMAHDTLQSPIMRGVFVLERFLCAPPPPPPANVKQEVATVATTDKTTLRQRIVRDHETGSCRSCHVSIDGVGFGMENFDAVGRYQTMENGVAVDASGSISGTSDADGDFNGAVELSRRLAKSAQVHECVTTQWARYALARALVPTDGCWVATLTDQMLASKGDMPALLTALVKMDAFRSRAPVTH